MWIIVGLGNPGPAYARNRHNVGHMCVDFLARQRDIAWQRRQLYQWGEGQIEGQDMALAKPRTFMNTSGKAVAAVARTYRAQPSDILVIHDEMDLPPGKLRFKLGGSPAGHKGVESIIAALGTRDFLRLRVGIGHPPGVEWLSPEAKAEVTAAYVLSDFAPEEGPLIREAVARVSEAVAVLLTTGLDAAMSRFH